MKINNPWKNKVSLSMAYQVLSFLTMRPSFSYRCSILNTFIECLQIMPLFVIGQLHWDYSIQEEGIVHTFGLLL